MAEEMSTIDNTSPTDGQKIFPTLQNSVPASKFVNSIPAQAQKGFTHLDIVFSSVDVCEQYLAIGTNIGLVYLFDRKREKLHKLRSKEFTHTITCVKMLVSLECLVAVGTEKGIALAYKVPFEDKPEIEKFKVDDLHNGRITSIDWAKNGIRFYSGDSSGIVVCTEIDHLEHQSSSHIVLQENSEIVQLEYSTLLLIISNLHRCVIYDFSNNEMRQIGQKERKSSGKFGATFFDGNKNCIFASRPGQRICKSDDTGIVSETIIMKASKDGAANSSTLPEDFQYGLLKMYNSKFLVTWSDDKIALIDPELKVSKCIWSGLGVVDVATCNDEIVVLQGSRDILRFAVRNEDEEIFIRRDDEIVNLGAEIEYPKKSSTFIETDATKVFDWIKRKFSESVAPAEENGKTTKSDSIDSLPDIVKMSPICPKIQLQVTKKDKEEDIPSWFNEDVVYKPKKKKKRKKKEVLEVIEPDTVDEDNKNGKSDHSIKIDNDSASNDVNTVCDKSSDCVDSIPQNSESSKVDCSLDSSCNISENATEQQNSQTPDTSIIVDDTSSISETNSTEKTEDNLDEDVATSEEDTYGDILSDILKLSITSNEVSSYQDDSDDPIGIDRHKKSSVESSEDNISNITETDASSKSEHLEKPVQKNESMEVSVLEHQKYGVECIQHSAPGALINLGISNFHVFCIDNQNNVFMSDFPNFGFKWERLNHPADQIAVSPSEDILWILYKNVVYTARNPYDMNVDYSWSKAKKWLHVASSVSYIAVDDTSSWCVTTGGDLYTNQGLTPRQPYSFPHKVYCPVNVVQVACRNSVVWVLADDGKVYFKLNDSSTPGNAKWEQLDIPFSVATIAFGCKKEAYIIGTDGTLWFRLGVMEAMPQGLSEMLQVESSLYIYQTAGNVWRVVNKVINPRDLLNNLISRQQQPSIISASDAGVWWCKFNDSTLYCYSKMIIGHSWGNVIPKGTLSTTNWSMVSAEGFRGSAGILWGVDTTGELINFSLKSSNTVVVNMPPDVSLKCVQAVPESMWILSTEGDIFIRREMSERCPQGMWWQELDATQIDYIHLCHMSCSSDIVWACDETGRAFVRIGNLNPQLGDQLSQVWINVDDEDDYVRPPPIVMSKVYVGPKSFMVWAIDIQGNVYVRTNISPKLLVGNQWTLVPGPHAKQLCISENSVWLLKQSGKIFRRFGINKNNLTGDYWKQMPGNLSFLSVTVDDNLWGVRDNSLCCNNSYTITFKSQATEKVNIEVLSDDDWEELTA